MKDDKGFTLIEVIISIVGIGVVVIVGSIIYTSFHFISKVW